MDPAMTMLEGFASEACAAWGATLAELRYSGELGSRGNSCAVIGARLEIYRRAYLSGIQPKVVAVLLGCTRRQADRVYGQFRVRLVRPLWAEALEKRAISRAKSHRRAA